MMIHEEGDENTLVAWQTFVTEGTVPEGQVRPEIARSWQRCREYRLDPWAIVPNRDYGKLQEKRRDYLKLLPIVTPAVQYIKVLMDANGLMADQEGFVYELLSPIKNYPRSLGTYQTERHYGTFSTTIALAEQIAIRTDGYEHYLVTGQNRSCASSPVFDIHKRLLGVLSAVRTFRRLPPEALACVSSLAKLIEYSLRIQGKTLDILKHPRVFQAAIDSCPHGVLILNHTGSMVAINVVLRKMLSLNDTRSFTAEGATCPLLDARELSILTNANLHTDERRWIIFKNPAAGKDVTGHRLCLDRAERIHLDNDHVHIALIFKEDQLSRQEQSSIGYSPAHKTKKLHDNVRVISIGNSDAWRAVNTHLLKVAPFASNVLLQGESGTGKEVVARLLHNISNRKGPFVPVNCGAYPKELLYGELFGYKSGAFTGAQKEGLIGKFEFANMGTLFLDEISEMPLDSQSSLLRAIEDRTIVRFGSNQSIKIDTLIIAATNKKMNELIDKGIFRKDLYYRLSAVEILLPPLRERKTDIPVLADYFASEFCEHFLVGHIGIRDDAMRLLYNYDWPGNVRELRNVIERALMLSGGNMITPESLPNHILLNPSAAQTGPDSDFNYSAADEAEWLVRELRQSKGNLARTAKALKISRVTLYKKLIKHSINIELFRQK